MCGCNKLLSLRCDFHRQMDIITGKEALRFLAHLREQGPPTGPVKRIPVPDYVQRIRTGTD